MKLLALVALFLGISPSTAQASSYFTASFGRAQTGVVTSAKTCNTSPASVDMATTVLPYLASKGIAPTMDVQLSLTTDGPNVCQSRIRYASWQDLQLWHTLYNVEAISAGDLVADYAGLTDAQVLQHSCGTLQTFTDHGFYRAAGMFASPSSSATAHQMTLLDSCFGLVRAYNNTKPTPLLNMKAPYRALTYSLTGGRCNDPAAPCYGMAVKNSRVYPDPDALIAQFNASPDNTWLNFQAYRFAIGTDPNPTSGWDCSSDDWHDHYTMTPEVFCWNDYQHIIDNLRPDFVPVDPETVAQLEGR